MFFVLLLHFLIYEAFFWLAFPGGSAGKESTCSAGDLSSITGLGRSPGEWNSYLLQHSGLQISMDYIAHRGHKELDTTEWLSHFYDLVYDLVLCNWRGPLCQLLTNIIAYMHQTYFKKYIVQVFIVLMFLSFYSLNG